MEKETIFCCRGEEKRERKRRKKFGEGKGDKYVEKQNVFLVEEEKNVGCTTEFKSRFGNHEKSFNHERYGHETVLSSHIWECKGRGSTCTVSWRVLDRGQPFNPVTKICKLCVREKFYIIRKPHLATLNHRKEVGAHCPHIVMSLISRVGKVKVGSAATPPSMPAKPPIPLQESES